MQAQLFPLWSSLQCYRGDLLSCSSFINSCFPACESHVPSGTSRRRLNHVWHIVSITAHQLSEYGPSLNRSKLVHHKRQIYRNEGYQKGRLSYPVWGEFWGGWKVSRRGAAAGRGDMSIHHFRFPSVECFVFCVGATLVFVHIVQGETCPYTTGFHRIICLPALCIFSIFTQCSLYKGRHVTKLGTISKVIIAPIHVLVSKQVCLNIT